MGDSACVGSDSVNGCQTHHTGPLCRVCETNDMFFDDGQGECIDCPPKEMSYGIMVGGTMAAVLGPPARTALAFFFLTFVAGRAQRVEAERDDTKKRSLFGRVTACAARMGTLVDQTGMVVKTKIIITFYQVAALIPRVYDVEIKANFDWSISAFGWFEFDWVDIVFPGSCFGKYINKVILAGFVPLSVVVLCPAIAVSIVFGKHYYQKLPGRPNIVEGIIDGIPMMLFLTFLFVQGVSIKIFQTWDCREFNEDAALPNPRDRPYAWILKEDYSLSCVDNEDYNKVLMISVILMCIWPFGLPILYGSLVFSNMALLKKNLTAAAEEMARRSEEKKNRRSSKTEADIKEAAERAKALSSSAVVAVDKPRQSAADCRGSASPPSVPSQDNSFNKKAGRKASRRMSWTDAVTLAAVNQQQGQDPIYKQHSFLKDDMGRKLSCARRGSAMPSRFSGTMKDLLNQSAGGDEANLSPKAKRARKMTQAIAFLYSGLRAERCWYECLDLVRKILLGGFYLFVIPEKNNFLRLLAAQLTSLFFLIVFLILWPYASDTDNVLMAVSQILLNLLFVTALHIKLYEELQLAELDDLLIQRILGFESVDSFVILLFVLTVAVVLIVVGVLIFQCVQAADAEFVMEAMSRSRSLSFTRTSSDRLTRPSARKSMNRLKSAALSKSKLPQDSDREDSKRDAPDCTASVSQESIRSTPDTNNGPRISHPSDRQPRISHPADRQSRACCEPTVERL